jgi:aminoglycoside phosphotransferase (APT) family kinase protein
VLGDAAAWTSPRLPPADNIAQRYAVASGRELIDWNFYLALGYFKLAVIAEGPPPLTAVGQSATRSGQHRDTVSKDKRRAIEHAGVQRKTVYKHHDLVAVIDQSRRQPIPSTSP